MLIDHVDLVNRKVYVEDPNCARYADQLPAEAKRRFKGRNTSEVVFIPQLKAPFFEALSKYLKYEYCPGSSPEYLFQDVRPGHRGRPFDQISDAAKAASFARACRSAGVTSKDGDTSYTLYSLRHMYGVYMLNYLPVDGGYGLSLAQVQRLMGHVSSKSTEVYAVEDDMILAAKLEYADRHLLSGTIERGSMALAIAERLEAE